MRSGGPIRAVCMSAQEKASSSTAVGVHQPFPPKLGQSQNPIRAKSVQNLTRDGVDARAARQAEKSA